MSLLNVPPFDLLTHQFEPYIGFGTPIMAASELCTKLASQAEQAEKRLKENFKLQLCELNRMAIELDSTIEKMWSQGWNPDIGNVNLFATDYGLVLFQSLNRKFGGSPIFRMENDLNHVSLWWPKNGIEAFPFHKILKCLYIQEGESISTFISSLSSLLSNRCNGSSDFV